MVILAVVWLWQKMMVLSGWVEAARCDRGGDVSIMLAGDDGDDRDAGVKSWWWWGDGAVTMSSDGCEEMVVMMKMSMVLVQDIMVVTGVAVVAGVVVTKGVRFYEKYIVFSKMFFYSAETMVDSLMPGSYWCYVLIIL